MCVFFKIIDFGVEKYRKCKRLNNIYLIKVYVESINL